MGCIDVCFETHLQTIVQNPYQMFHTSLHVFSSAFVPETDSSNNIYYNASRPTVSPFSFAWHKQSSWHSVNCFPFTHHVNTHDSDETCGDLAKLSYNLFIVFSFTLFILQFFKFINQSVAAKQFPIFYMEFFLLD